MFALKMVSRSIPIEFHQFFLVNYVSFYFFFRILLLCLCLGQQCVQFRITTATIIVQFHWNLTIVFFIFVGVYMWPKGRAYSAWQKQQNNQMENYSSIHPSIYLSMCCHFCGYIWGVFHSDRNEIRRTIVVTEKNIKTKRKKLKFRK